MKKTSIFLLFIICVLIFIGCMSKDQKKNDKKIGVEIKSVENTVDYYMKQISKDNYEEVKKLYTKELAENIVDKIDDNLKVRGYKITQISETGEAGYVKVRVAKMNTKKPACVLDEAIFKVVKVNDEYKISEINNISIGEIFEEEGNLRFKNRDDVRTNLLIYKDSLPKYAFSKDDVANLNKIPITKGNFKLTNLNFSGDKAVLSMEDDYTYIGVVNIDQSLEALNKQIASNGEDAGNQNKEGEEGEGAKEDFLKGREKPIGKQLINLDILKGTNIEFMLFSQDEKFVIVQYNDDNGVRCMRVYSSDSGDLIPFKFEENFNINEVDVIFDYFDKDILNFEVKSKKGKEENQKDLVGKWELDLKGFKVKKK